MGSRGASKGTQGTTRRAATTMIGMGGGGAPTPPINAANPGPQPQQNPPQPNVQQMVQNAQNNQQPPVVPNGVQNLASMSDAQLASLFNSSKSTQLPNHLNDAHDVTQKFVYTAGLNAKPQVLDKNAFNQYLKQNGISRSQILSRSVNGGSYTVNGIQYKLSPSQVTDLIKYGDLNYIGGKHGGQALGAGTYYDMNGGRNTGYAGGATTIAVLSPSARPIDRSTLGRRAAAFDRTHPQFARATGGYNSRNMSVYALVMGYNVITAQGSGYHNVIDRSAIICQKENI